ncbi:hypothetical protein [Streptomyces sp. NPDC088348]|uniref:hypothetical protein n=1 Tax=Streptomyces sp. NPDC088348 TaxID=3365853 RepID=UPI0037F2F69C
MDSSPRESARLSPAFSADAAVEQALASAGTNVCRTAGPVGFAASLRLFEQFLHATSTAATDDEASAAELAAARVT